MSKSLDVYLDGHLAGVLQQNKHGQISFSYCAEWLNDAHAMPLSHSLPLLETSFEAKECQGFFAGVLPEEDNRDIIASLLGVSARNDFALLEQIGGECAGAVSFVPHQSDFPKQESRYQRLSDQELANILQELPSRPLMAGHKDIRLSLAGAQSKLAVHVTAAAGNSRPVVSLPLNNAPSTHIIKPVIERFPDIVDNEFFCMTLARRSGLPVADASSGSVGGVAYYMTMRYDRIFNVDVISGIERIHQEDFCQALGLPPHLKYQNEGGPSIVQCFDLIRSVCSTPAPDLLTFLDAIVFNYLIGNNDAHGKNFSFLYERVAPGSSGYIAKLAPLYDLISTSCYPDLTPKMAMKIGKKYLPARLQLEHWQQLWKEAGFTESQAYRRMIQFTEKVLMALGRMTAENQTQDSIGSFVKMRAEAVKRLKQ